MGSLNRHNVFDSTTVDEVHPDNSVMYEGAFGRPLMQHLHGFLKCMLQEGACFSRWKVFLSCKRKISLLLPWLNIA